MSKDTYSEVSKYFGIEPLEEVIQGQLSEEVLCN